MKHQRLFFYLISAILFLTIAACSPEDSSKTRQGAGIEAIHCEVYYRSKAGLPLESAPVSPLREHNDQLLIEFEDMVFEARYQVDEFEGRALYISVTDPDSGTEINRVLYQFDSQNPPENQFVGGHGFTGLNYLYHSTSTSEMQYFCTVE
jgi:hypothetical protein